MCRKGVNDPLVRFDSPALTVTPPPYARRVKRCKKCGETKPLDEFYRAQGMRDGHRSDCKACNLAAKRVWYDKNREHAIAKATAWQRENAERYRARQQAYRDAGRSATTGLSTSAGRSGSPMKSSTL